MEPKDTTMIILGIVAVIAVVGLVLLFKHAMLGASVLPKYGYENPFERAVPTPDLYAQQQACQTLAAQHAVPSDAVMPADETQVPLYGAGNCFATGQNLPKYCCIPPSLK